MMKSYCIVRLSNLQDSSQSKRKQLPATFTERSRAQETCDELNRGKGKVEATFVVEERQEIIRSFRQSG